MKCYIVAEGARARESVRRTMPTMLHSSKHAPLSICPCQTTRLKSQRLQLVPLKSLSTAARSLSGMRKIIPSGQQHAAAVLQRCDHGRFTPEIPDDESSNTAPSALQPTSNAPARCYAKRVQRRKAAVLLQRTGKDGRTARRLKDETKPMSGSKKMTARD